MRAMTSVMAGRDAAPPPDVTRYKGGEIARRKLLKGLQYVPRIIMTDKLKSYGAAKCESLPGVEHRQSCSLTNRCEIAHRPTRQRERRSRGFNQRGMLSAFYRRMAPLPTTAAPD